MYICYIYLDSNENKLDELEPPLSGQFNCTAKLVGCLISGFSCDRLYVESIDCSLVYQILYIVSVDKHTPRII